MCYNILLCDAGLPTQYFTKNVVYMFARFCHQDILQSLKVDFSLNVAPKVPNISPFTKFHRLFKCLFASSMMPQSAQCPILR